MKMKKFDLRHYFPYSFIFLLLLLAVVTRSLPGLIDPYKSTGDQKQHIFWLYQYQDPELFNDDYITEFFSTGKVDPYGFVSIFRITSSIMDPLLLSKILAVILMGISVIYIYRLANSLGGRTAGFVSGTLFICNALILQYANLFEEGLPRSFAYPLLISFLYYVVKKDNVMASISLLLQSLFYPPIFLNSAVFWGLSCLKKGWIQELRRSKLLIAGFIIAGSIIFYSSITGPDSLGTFITLEEAKNMPEFGPNGRTKLFEDGIVNYVYSESRAGLNLINVELYVLLLMPMLLILGTRLFRVNRIIYDVAISSLILFIIAQLVLFKLFLPSRYVIYSLPIALNLLLSLNFQPFMDRIRTKYGFDLILKLSENKRVFIIVLIGIIFVSVVRMVSFRPEQENIEIYKYFNKLPKNVLIAGYPYDMNGIPLFSRRKVLISHEHALPYYNNYYSEMKKKTFDFFSAYYSNNYIEIVKFCTKYNVDYLVVNQDHFDNNFINGWIYYSPFGEHAKEIIKRNKSPYLKNPKNYKSIFFEDNYSVVKCEPNSFYEVRENE